MIPDPFIGLLRTCTHPMPYQAVVAEADGYIAGYEVHHQSDGHFRIVCKGYQSEQAIQIRHGPVAIRIPKGRSRAEETVALARC